MMRGLVLQYSIGFCSLFLLPPSPLPFQHTHWAVKSWALSGDCCPLCSVSVLAKSPCTRTGSLTSLYTSPGSSRGILQDSINGVYGRALLYSQLYLPLPTAFPSGKCRSPWETRGCRTCADSWLHSPTTICSAADLSVSVLQLLEHPTTSPGTGSSEGLVLVGRNQETGGRAVIGTY